MWRRGLLGFVLLALVAGLPACGDDPDTSAEQAGANPAASAPDETEKAETAADPEQQGNDPEEKATWRDRLKAGLAKGKEKATRLARSAERTLGEELSPLLIAQHGGRYPDQDLHDFLGKIVAAMAEECPEPDLAWEIVVLNDPVPGAYSLPGGKLFVSRGLLALLDTEAQIAHVLGHEMAHVIGRDVVAKYGIKALRKTLVKATAEGERKALEKDPDDPAYVATGVDVGSRLAALGYSRHQELEADRLGVDYAVAAGYDPREGKKTFELFLRLREASDGESPLLNLLSTHPLDSKRIEQLDSYIEERYPAVAAGERSLVKRSAAWNAHRVRLLVTKGK